MEVDPPKEEAKADSNNGDAPPKTEAGDKGNAPKGAEGDTEMKDENEKTEEQPAAAKKEVRTEKRKKVVSKTIDLPITTIVVGAMSRDKLETALEQEKVLVNQDIYEGHRLIAKNAVEEYIYSIREKIHDELENYILEADREAYSRKLSETEDWLYEDGEDCEKAVYEDKLKELKIVGEAARKRKSEYEGRKASIDTLGHSLQMASKVVELYRAGDEKYTHLTDSEMERVTKLIQEKLQWLNNSVATLESTPKTVNPSILNCQFISEKDGFEAVCRPILNKPKPKAEPPKEEAKKTEEATAAASEDLKKEANATATPMDSEAGAAPSVNGNNGAEKQEQTMDLD